MLNKKHRTHRHWHAHIQLSSVSSTVIGTHWNHIITDAAYSESPRAISEEMSAY